MANFLTAAISFAFKPIAIGADPPYEIAVASCLADEQGVELLCALRWVCAMPDPNRYVEQPYGSSETIGLLGGVKQAGAAASSETLERALGDGITLAFAQILDLDAAVQIVLVRGPVFPKVLGRFLSLRPPSEKVIAWVSLGSGNIQGGGTSSGVERWPRRLVSFRGEGLITCVPFTHSGRQWWIEYVDLDGSLKHAERVQSLLNRLKVPVSAGAVPLPRELEFGLRALPSPKDSSFVGPGNPPGWFKTPTELVDEPCPETGMGRSRMIYRWREAK